MKVEYKNIYQQLYKTELPLDLYYVSIVKTAMELKENKQNEIQKLASQHFQQTFSQVQQRHSFQLPPVKMITSKVIYLPPQQGPKVKKTLILDLDETMVHCNENLNQAADFFLSISISFGYSIKAGVRVRPYLMEFLKQMQDLYEVIVFTASHRIYAEAVLNKLDPDGLLVHFLFSRESCIQDKGCYIKDLRILNGRDMSQVLIVDNSTMSFIYQLENGIPIIPFYSYDQDEELKSLASFLTNLAEFEDVRQPVSQYFQLHQLDKFNESKEAADQLYNNEN